MINWFCFLCPQYYLGNHFHVNEITNFINYTILNYCEVLFIKCSPRGHKESDTSERLNWTDLHKRLILEGTVAGDIFQLKPLLGFIAPGWKKMKNSQTSRLDPNTLRNEPAMPEGEPVYAIYILLQTKLDFHICPHLKYEGIKTWKPVGGKS